MNWYFEVLRKYAVFSGRAGRQEYWFFVFFNLIIGFVLAIIDALIGSFGEELGIGLLEGLYGLAVLLPGLAVTVRRLHDTERSGWWLLIFLIPLIGAIVIIIFTLQDSIPGENRYGPNPKLGGTA